MKIQFIVKTVGDVSVLLTFGIAFPPLAFFVMVSIIIDVVRYTIVIN
jgi:hypothetical protein